MLCIHASQLCLNMYEIIFWDIFNPFMHRGHYSVQLFKSVFSQYMPAIWGTAAYDAIVEAIASSFSKESHWLVIAMGKSSQ